MVSSVVGKKLEVRWCQGGVRAFWEVLGRCQNVSRLCQQGVIGVRRVPGRCEMVSEIFHMVSRMDPNY